MRQNFKKDRESVKQYINYDKKIELAILGKTQVGKSCLISRFVNKTFLESYQKTIGIDFDQKMLNINDEIIKIEILDCAGDVRFSNFLISYIRVCKIFFLVYDITQKQTFENLKELYLNLIKNKTSDIVIMIIGNKLDKNKDRQVTTEEGINFAYEKGLFFTEMSAKKLINVEEAFIHAAKIIYELEQNENYKLQSINKRIPEDRTAQLNVQLEQQNKNENYE